MARTIDLNKARAARAEKRTDEPVVVLIGDEQIKLPAELPLDFAFDVESDARGAVGRLLGERASAVMADWSIDDFRELLEQVTAVYGVSPGESTPSDGTS